MIKVITSGISVDMVGEVKANWSDDMKQATTFKASYNEQLKATTMLEASISALTKWIGRQGAKHRPNRAS